MTKKTTFISEGDPLIRMRMSDIGAVVAESRRNQSEAVFETARTFYLGVVAPGGDVAGFNLVGETANTIKGKTLRWDHIVSARIMDEESPASACEDNTCTECFGIRRVPDMLTNGYDFSIDQCPHCGGSGVEPEDAEGDQEESQVWSCGLHCSQKVHPAYVVRRMGVIEGQGGHDVKFDADTWTLHWDQEKTGAREKADDSESLPCPGCGIVGHEALDGWNCYNSECKVISYKRDGGVVLLGMPGGKECEPEKPKCAECNDTGMVDLEYGETNCDACSPILGTENGLEHNARHCPKCGFVSRYLGRDTRRCGSSFCKVVTFAKDGSAVILATSDGEEDSEKHTGLSKLVTNLAGRVETHRATIDRKQAQLIEITSQKHELSRSLNKADQHAIKQAAQIDELQKQENEPPDMTKQAEMIHYFIHNATIDTVKELVCYITKCTEWEVYNFIANVVKADYTLVAVQDGLRDI